MWFYLNWIDNWDTFSADDGNHIPAGQSQAIPLVRQAALNHEYSYIYVCGINKGVRTHYVIRIAQQVYILRDQMI